MNSIKNCNNKNSIRIYINLYVHYLETFSGTIINDKLLEYFYKYFEKMDLIIKSDVMINSLPHSEKEIINLEIYLDSCLNNKISKETMLKDWEQYIKKFFNNEFKEVSIDIK